MQTPLEEQEDELESLKKAEGMAFLLQVTEPQGVYHEGKMGVTEASHPHSGGRQPSLAFLASWNAGFQEGSLLSRLIQLLMA